MMENPKDKALIKAGVGLATKDKELALAGINEFIRISILELEMDRWEAKLKEWGI